MAAPLKTFACRPLSRGETRPNLPPPAEGRGLPPQAAGNVQPLALGSVDDPPRIGEERRARLLAVKEIKPLSGHRPDQGMALYRPAPANRQRVIAGKARRVDFRVLRKGALVALVREAPDRPVEVQFELRP